MPAWTPSLEWKDQDAFLIGGGSSLAGFDFSILKQCNVIGCNDAWHLGEEIVKICLFGDASWWERNKQDLKQFKGRVVTCAPTLLPLQLSWLWQMERIRDGLHEGHVLGWNYSTGAAAINLAVTLGATRIFLLGYDLGPQNGKVHWHSYAFKPPNIEAFIRFTRGFTTLAQSLKRRPDVRILNVTDGSSKLPVFERISVAHFLSIIKTLTPAPPQALSGCVPRSATNGRVAALQAQTGQGRGLGGGLITA